MSFYLDFEPRREPPPRPSQWTGRWPLAVGTAIVLALVALTASCARSPVTGNTLHLTVNVLTP